jgi:pimeloyl-ACP methyl ester carboxylesterase
MAYDIPPPDFASFWGDQYAVFYPGLNGSRHGYEQKYLRMAYGIGLHGFSSALTDNPAPFLGVDLTSGSGQAIYADALIQHLRETIWQTTDYALRNDVVNPRLYLVGVTDGASAIAAIAHEFPSVERILLIAPSYATGAERMRYGLARFDGDVRTVVGRADTVIGTETAEVCHESATAARSAELVIANGVNHYFAGCEDFFQTLPEWAFCGGPLNAPARSTHVIGHPPKQPPFIPGLD